MRSALLKVFGIIAAFALGTWLMRPLWGDDYGWCFDCGAPPTASTPYYERMLNQHPVMILTFAVVTVLTTVVFVSRRLH